MAFPVLGALIARVVAGSAVRAGVASAAEGLAARVATKKLGQETLAKVAQGAVKPKGMPVSVLEDTKLTNARAMTRALSGGVKDSVQRAIQPSTAAGGAGSKPPVVNVAAPGGPEEKWPPGFEHRATRPLPKPESAKTFWPPGRGPNMIPPPIAKDVPMNATVQARETPSRFQNAMGSVAKRFGDFKSVLGAGQAPGPIGDDEQKDKQRRADAEVTDATKNLIRSFTLLGGAGIGLTLASKRYALSLVESNAHMRRFNGQIAVAYAKLAQGDILRARASANATAGSTAALADAVNGMKDELRPLVDLGTNLMNIVGTQLAKVVTVASAMVKAVPAVILISKVAGWWMGSQKQQKAMWQEFFDRSNKRAGLRKRPPIEPGTRR